MQAIIPTIHNFSIPLSRFLQCFGMEVLTLILEDWMIRQGPGYCVFY